MQANEMTEDPDGLCRRTPSTDEWRYMQRRAREAIARAERLREIPAKRIADDSIMLDYYYGHLDCIDIMTQIISDVFFLDVRPD
jgi:hypothetical protein